LLANRVLIFRFQLLAVYVLLVHSCGECRFAIWPFGHFIIFLPSTLFDASRRYLTLLDATRRYFTLLHASQRYLTRFSTLLDAA
jgi:hypothetical protein